jgi:hypothetical protein
MGGESRRPGRTVGSLRQAAEYLLAALLATGALHTNRGAPILLVAAGVVAGWAAVHDAPLAVLPTVGPGLHRAGLLGIAVGLLAAPAATRTLTDFTVSGPALLGALLLFQLALRRRRSVRSAGTEPPPPPSPPPSQPSRVPVARVTGVAAARAGILAAKHVDRAVPAGARHAGRLVGRLKQRRPPQ